MPRFFLTIKRVVKGLKITVMLLFAVVAYAAILKRGKTTPRSLFSFLGTGVAVAILFSSSAPAISKSPVKSQPVSKAPAKQIYTRSNRSMRSEALGLSGQAAYIVSSVGTRSGILITEVSGGGTAAKVGITPGDVLLTLNQRVVTTATDADRILGDTATGSVKVSFAHPSENGLQLYNTNFNYSSRGVITSAASVSSSSRTSSNSSSSLTSQIPSTESQMLGVINQDRATEHAPAVGSNNALASLARAHAQDMAKRGYFNHVNPDGLNPQDRADRAGAGKVFENISWASGVTDLTSAANTAEHNMMGEPPNQQNHRSNIIDPAHKTVGVGIAVSKEGVFYMAQEFSNGSP